MAMVIILEELGVIDPMCVHKHSLQKRNKLQQWSNLFPLES